MARETVADKAVRYLGEGRLIVERVERNRVAASCRGDGTRYRIPVPVGPMVVLVPSTR